MAQPPRVISSRRKIGFSTPHFNISAFHNELAVNFVKIFRCSSNPDEKVKATKSVSYDD